jgi:polyisoprenoid-binding protein YceI
MLWRLRCSDSFFLLFVAFSGARAQEFVVDTARSSVRFEVEHLGVLNVTGRFGKFSGTLTSRGGKSAVRGVVEAASITTGNAYRDNLLRGKPYLFAERYPRIAFDGNGIRTQTGEVVSGTLTIRSESRAIRWEGTWKENGRRLIAKFIIRRRDFGLDFGAMDDLIGNEITIDLDLFVQPL